MGLRTTGKLAKKKVAPFSLVGMGASQPDVQKEMARLLIRHIEQQAVANEEQNKRLNLVNAELEEKNNYLNAILESISTPLLVLDRTFKVKLANEAFFNLFQLSPEETIEHSLFQMDNSEWNLPALRGVMENVFVKNSPFKNLVVERLSRRIGKKTLRLGAKQILQKGLATETVLLSIEDVSAEKRRAELEKSNQELKGFTYAASHDLQEPLRMISSYLELVKVESLEKLELAQIEYLDFAIESANRMKSLIDDLLAYARVGSTETEPEPVNLENLFNQVLEELRTTLIESQITISHSPLPTVLAERNQLRQVFQNLIDNAIKFRRGPNPKLHIVAERKGEEWVFAFKDNGIGFEMKYADKVFQIFQRLHKKEDYSGTGIGLPICKKAIENSGGSIWLESEPDQGTTFFFTLPAAVHSELEAGSH